MPQKTTKDHNVQQRKWGKRNCGRDNLDKRIEEGERETGERERGGEGTLGGLFGIPLVWRKVERTEGGLGLGVEKGTVQASGACTQPVPGTIFMVWRWFQVSKKDGSMTPAGGAPC